MKAAWTSLASNELRSGISISLGGERVGMTNQDHVAQIFEEYRVEIYRYTASLGLDAGLAQEITQDAFLRIYVELEKGVSIANERAWLFRTAHNLAINLGLKSNRMEPLLQLGNQIVDPVANPEQALLETEKRNRLRRAISSLSAQQRQCLHLRAEGLRYREIASVIGIKTSTVSEFLRRAINKLKEVRHE